MARTALQIAGGVVGFFLGGPLGAQIGFVAGGIVGNLAFPQEGPNIQGPRISDLNIQASAPGLPIPLVFGTFRLAGNVIWATQIKERKITQEVGGKGGGGGTTQTTFLYSVDMAVGICKGPIVGIRKVWADTKLIYDISDTASFDEQLASKINLGSEVRSGQTISEAIDAALGFLGTMIIYVGDQTQEPDPLIEADKGTGQVPANRGLAYVVFDDLQLRNFGNRIPNFSFEVVFVGTETVGTQLGFVQTPDSDGNEFYGIQSTFLDSNGEMIVALKTFVDRPYTGTSWKVMRVIGTTMINVPRVPPPSLIHPLAGASTARFPFKNHMDHAGYFVEVAGDHGYMADWSTQTFVQFDDMVGLEAMAQKGGDVLFTNSNDLFHFTIGGSFIQKLSGGIVPNFRDIGITDNFFWAIHDNAGTLWRIKKSDLSVDATFSTGITAIQPSNMVVISDTLIYVTGWFGATLNVEHVFKIQISSTDVLTLTDLFTGIMTPSGNQGSSSVQHFMHVSGTMFIFGRPQQGTAASRIWYFGDTLGTNTIPLSTVVSDLCVRAGLKTSEIDVTALAATNVSGYAVGRELSTRQVLAPLQTAFSFDGFESDGKIKFIKRGGASIEAIPETELAARDPSAEIPDLVTTRRINEKELPREVNVVYVNNGNDQQQGEQRATRLITKSDLVSSIEVALSMTDNEARQIADVLLYEAWLSRHERTVQVSRRYLFLDPTDVITVTASSATFVLKIIEQSFDEPGILTLRCLDEQAAVFASAAVGGVSDPVQTPPGLVGSTLMALLDIPLLRDQDDHPGFYAAARGFTTIWPGTVLFRSLDGGESFSQMIPLFNETPIGEAITVLASGPTTIFDETNTVTVRLAGGTLTSTTEINVLNGSNACALGAEILQFKTATLNGDGDYVLSGLLRARRGTEQHVGTHAVGDRFVLLQESTVRDVMNSLSEIGIARVFKAPTIGLRLEEADQISFTDNGVRLEPLSVVHVTVTRNVPAAGDITLAWIRRGRIGPEWRDLVDVPLGEATESYSIDVFDNGTIVRILTSTSESVVYTSAQQTTDGFTPPRDPLHVKIFQISADAGRGFENDFTG